jgi:SAM-dependent methyltransferase
MFRRMTNAWAANRRRWDTRSGAYQASVGESFEETPRTWGAWLMPESEIGALGDVSGLTVLEAGCGAAGWTRWMTEDGAIAVGLDVSPKRLLAAQALGSVPLVQGDGAVLPFASGAFDLVMCDHGVLSWCDPFVTVPEVARVLRAGGRLVFSFATALLAICTNHDGVLTPQLQRAYFGFRGDANTDGSRWYALPTGEWIRLLRVNGFLIDDLIELQPPADRPNHFYNGEPPDWHNRWPAEAIWVATKA